MAGESVAARWILRFGICAVWLRSILGRRTACYDWLWPHHIVGQQFSTIKHHPLHDRMRSHTYLGSRGLNEKDIDRNSRPHYERKSGLFHEIKYLTLTTHKTFCRVSLRGAMIVTQIMACRTSLNGSLLLLSHGSFDLLEACVDFGSYGADHHRSRACIRA